MAFKQKMRVLGVKIFKGKIDNSEFDFTKLTVEMPFPSNSNNIGNDAVDLPFGTAATGEKLRALGVQFPAEYEIDLHPSTKGFECVGFPGLK